MRLTSNIVAVLWACALTAQSADTAVPQALDGLSQCALNCVTSTPSSANCSSTDTACMCADTETQAAVANCIVASCTVKESLTARNVTATICHETSRDDSSQLSAINLAMMVISAVFIALRIGHKLATPRNSQFGLDDLFIVLTFLILLPNTICISVKLLPLGLGRDIWTLPFNDITEYLRFFYWGTATYLATLPVLKMSFLFFYKRIFTAQPIQRIIIGTIVVNAVWGFSMVTTALFVCTPIPYFWHRWDHEHKGHCMNIGAMNWANAIVSIVLDLWMLAIPLSQLVHLQMSSVKKCGVILMFVLGALATVIAMVRLKYLAIVSHTDNPTWDQRQITKWSNIEIAVGVVCACLPSIRVILVRFLPGVFGSTHDTHQNQYASTHIGASRYSRFPSTKSSSTRADPTNSKHKHRTTTSTIQHETKNNSEVELVDIERDILKDAS